MKQQADHSTSGSVISPQFCYPHPIEITVAQKFWSMINTRYEVTDVNGNVNFKIPIHRIISPDTRRILDSSGRTVVTCVRKKYSRHGRWKVFRGESTDQAGDLIFSTSVDLSTFMHPRNNLRVFLANNATQEVCDYLVKAKSSLSSGKVYAGESSTSTVIAQFYKNIALAGREKYVITVYPNVDYLFIVSLIVILDETM